MDTSAFLGILLCFLFAQPRFFHDQQRDDADRMSHPQPGLHSHGQPPMAAAGRAAAPAKANMVEPPVMRELREKIGCLVRARRDGRMLEETTMMVSAPQQHHHQHISASGGKKSALFSNVLLRQHKVGACAVTSRQSSCDKRLSEHLLADTRGDHDQSLRDVSSGLSVHAAQNDMRPTASHKKNKPRRR